MRGGDAHAPVSGGGASAGRVPEPAKGRKEARPTLCVEKSRPLGTLPDVASGSLSPSPTSAAETLILPREFLPWPQQIGPATCNLQIMVITKFAHLSSVHPLLRARGVRTDQGEAGEVGPQPAQWANPESVQTSLHLPVLQHGDNCIYHERRL